ncbi:MAG: hypothetical protein ACKVJI_11025 [Pseudomonadales bacterium]|jgi:hypothetical protein|tara:strand:- start:61 stop:267 length:207 start_codon:yes stop_codon:yes gene_type:complete
MSTGGFDNWLGSISEIGAIYPLVGGEGLWVLICLGFWIWWHVAQMRIENLEHNQIIQELEDEELFEEN